MTAAVQPPYSSTGSAWEEQIVPTLRKRLEQESRILENRLSVHSLTSNSRDEHYQQPNPSSTSQSAQSRKQQQPSQSDSRSPTPSSRVQGNRNYSDTYRQTAIPRPNSSMAKDPLYSADRPHTAATIVAPGPSNVSRDGSSSNISGSGSNKVPFTRSRTRSTPYPFEKDEENSTPAPNGRRTPNAGLNYGGRHASGTADSSAMNGIPTPASSRANSPMIMNGKLPSQPPPSKIPQRKRARSSSNSDAPMKASVGRAAGSKIAKRAGTAGQDHITFPPSPETSPDIWRDQSNDAEPPRNLHPGDKIRDEAPPFNPNRLSAAPSFEEREFEHWYRGEGRDGGGRNGGRGEIKVVKAHTQKEMLEIAVGGYDLGADEKWMSSRRKQQAALDTLNMRRREAEQMDYVPHERELSDMEADYSEDAHDQAAGEDPYEYYYTTHDDAPPAPEPSRLPSPPLPKPAPPSAIPVAQPQPRPSMDSRPQSPSSSASHGTAKQVRKSNGHAANSSESSRKGGRPSAAKTPSTPRKSQPRQRAQSRPSNAAGERAPVTADAIPPWAQSPRPPTGGNWDDMVLPAVAKKMGLNNASQPDITMLGTDTIKQKEKEKQQVYAPAAGTFGYDPTKRRDEATKRLDKPAAISTDWGDALSLPSPVKPSSPPATHDFPPRQDSPPPFSSYTIGLHDKEPEPEVASAAPSQHSQPSSESRLPRPPPVSLSKEELKQRGKELRKSRPAIVVTSPSEMATPMSRAGKDEDEGAGCCKCVIM